MLQYRILSPIMNQKMHILTLKLKDGSIVKGEAILHFQLAEEMNIDFDEIVDVGFITRGRIVWLHRKPH